MRSFVDIEGLKYYANHGVLAQERTVGNLFEVSMRLCYDAERAMRSDNIEFALNYAEAVECVTRTMAQPSALLENVAYRIKEALLLKFSQIEGGRITVKKPHPPIDVPMDCVSFTTEW